MKKNIIIIVVVIVILSIITFVLTKEKNKNHKTLSEHNYIIEKETDITNNDLIGKLPIINLNSKDIQKINNEIMKEYYECAYGEDDVFYYEYSVYKDILSIMIRVTKADDTQYGTIEYHFYNINVKNEKQLNDEELLKYLKVSNDDLESAINKKLKSYYDKDDLNKDMSYDEYIKYIKYSSSNNNLVILKNNLYVYTTFSLTRSLIDYPGNINEIEVKKLK